MMTEQEFWDILRNMPDPLPVSWRLYYDPETGQPICYSMEDLPGNYIDVDAETFARSPMNVRVVAGQLKYIVRNHTHKLAPSDSGTACDPKDVAVVVSTDQAHQYWKHKTYEN